MSNEIKVTYIDSKDYRLMPTTGAHGGPATSGEIIVDFYVERTAPPDELTIVLDDEGNVKEKIASPRRIIRERQVGLVLRPDIALTIGNWLIARANSVIKQVSEDKEKDPVQ